MTPDTITIERMLEAADALEPDRSAAIRARTTPQQRAADRAAVDQLLEHVPHTPPAVRVPPPGLGWAVRQTGTAVLSSHSAVRRGERLALRLPPLDDADEREVIVLATPAGHDAWRVLSPTSSSRRTRVGALGSVQGGYQVDLVIDLAPGRWRVAVACPPWDRPDDEASLDGVLAALSAGRVPVGSVDVVVEDDPRSAP